MRLVYLMCCLTCLVAATPCSAADTEKTGFLGSGNVLMIQGAPGVVHFNSDPAHAKYSWLVGAELQTPSRWLAGYSYFNNSFDQKSHYIYGGYTWNISDRAPNWYAKLTGGVILGYKEPYEDKIPFNHNGVAPGVVPALGYKFDRYNVQLNLLGTAGFMITAGYDLFR
jgi:hypothetical protein